MATFQLRHFSSPEVLSSIAPDRLLALLTPHRDYFVRRGYEPPATGQAHDLDYQALVRIFLTPDARTPRELLDALFLIDEMSTTEAMESLIDAVSQSEHELDAGNDHTPADIAVQVWLLDRELLERKHAQQHLIRPKSFEYFQTERTPIPTFVLPTADTRRKIEHSLDDWFEKKKRGRGARIFVYDHEDEVWFLIRHGEPFKREESLHGGDVESVCYRPLKYDVAVYNRYLGEVRINAQRAGEKKLYREQLGHHLFGDSNFFSLNKKYTLAPLPENGHISMSCGDIEGIESITLTEVQFRWGGAYSEFETRKASDVFAAFETRHREFPDAERIVKAVLKVSFTDSKKERSVTIRPPNVAQYTRDSDAGILEQWLEQRGFVVKSNVDERAVVA